MTIGLKVSNSPISQILCGLALGLSRHPKLKVLKAIVITNSISVMDVFIRFKRSAKMKFHDVAMFSNWFSINMDYSVSRVVNRAAFVLSLVCTFSSTKDSLIKSYGFTSPNKPFSFKDSLTLRAGEGWCGHPVFMAHSSKVFLTLHSAFVRTKLWLVSRFYFFKHIATFLANVFNEQGHFGLELRDSFRVSPLAAASDGAKALRLFSGRYVKNVSAFFTYFLNSVHLKLLSVNRNDTIGSFAVSVK